MAQTIIVSNRLPVSVRKTPIGIELYPSSGGLATGLASYAGKRNNLWIGWPGIVSDDLTEREKREITAKLASYNCQPVFLTAKQVEEYYSGYSNSILWPFLHNLHTNFAHEDRYWRAYRKVNELFREAVLALSDTNSAIWVHDYQLFLLPKLLREQRPDAQIGFFLHIPFPKARHFTKLKEAGSIIRGILGADLVGFHTTDYADGFLESSQELTTATLIEGGIAYRDRALRVADFPMGIDYVKFSSATLTRDVQTELRRLKRRYSGQKIILTVDRLDPTKGFMERLRAYQSFLNSSPELHGKVVMLMLAVPSRGEIDAYQVLKKRVEKLVKDINRRFGSATWKPVVYMHKSVNFEELSALYQAADVAFVAPIRDGMNLVAKEYVASKGSKKGILILSETAGAAKELREALLVNPSQPKTLVDALKTALTMQPKELKERLNAMQESIAINTVYDWAGDFMAALNQPVPLTRTPQLTSIRRKNLISNFQGATKPLLIFDYDGVLTPFVSDPSTAEPSAAILGSLKRIITKGQATVVIVSGRNRQDMEMWFGHLPITLVAEHGALIRRPGNNWYSTAPSSSAWKRILKPALQKHAADTPGAFVEEKSYSLVWHYRNASPYSAQKNIAILKDILKPAIKQFGLKIHSGNKIIEIKDPRITKGHIVKDLLDKPYDFILALGDDYTDEDMFKALPKRAYTIKIGPGNTHARYRLKTPHQVQDLLARL